MTYSPGLAGVVVADSALSHVDGAAGELVIRGHRLAELAGRAGFEDVLWLLARGELPDASQRSEVRLALGAARLCAHERLERLGPALDHASPMAALAAALGNLDLPREDPLAIGCAASGALATLAAAWWRRSLRLPALAPVASAGHARDYLRLVTGRDTAEADGAALDAYWVAVADHGLNASTFAARVVASTGADAGGALMAALAALSGPLHGGAPGPVLAMLRAIERPEAARAHLERELAQGRRIMGMGHRVYRVRDPRAAALEAALGRLEASLAGDPRALAIRARLALARAVEREALSLLQERHPTRALRANVEFYTAVLLDALDLPEPLFTPTFAIARSAGWAAHIIEQGKSGRLMRPLARYVGPSPR